MGWARLDDRWHDHPKTITVGLEGAGLFVMCLTWAHQARRTSPTPGVIPDAVLARLAGSKAKKLTKVLHDAGFLDDRTPAGWPIHDFDDYLPKYDSEQARAAGSAGGKARAIKQTASKPLSEPSHETEADRVAEHQQTSSTRASARRNPVPVPKELPPSAGEADAPPGPPSESHDQRVNRVTKTYTDLVPLSKFVAIRSVVSKALTADFTEDQVTPALLRMANDNRTVTIDALRTEMVGLPPSRFTNGHNRSRPTGTDKPPPQDQWLYR